ncbi:PQQ-binding-like beta-propeller repeat protein [Streptomyces indicus]|uniref:Outer membrane protein assembly factor BamB, contains PQQ-like beta-propeller repeat n=1 Tax=Streptomyces indicus TaxID=417292 RepID=A0A1G8UY79_9ACTN|nr:PQQ-binding-like beta-propeller repeat protein [Streptomyces indicus]SDJ58816.1 Outer membrane protein assembly factor BamB, contains PQQ-like beta-propeller repeat [Streptomyces indicus]
MSQSTPPPPQPGFGPPVTPPPFLAAPPSATVTPPPDRRPPRSRLRWIVAAVVALALLAGGGVWFAVAGDGEGGAGDGKQADARFDGPGTEKKPATTEAGLLFHVNDPKVGKGDFYPAPGSWVTEETYVKSGVGNVVGYDLDSGRQVWEIPLGGQVCGYTQRLDEGRTGVLYRDGREAKGKATPCTEIAVLDLDAGMLLWRGSVELSGKKTIFAQIAVGAGKVAVAGDEGGAAFDLATGELRWKPQPGEPCYDMAYGGGDDLVALEVCGQDGNQRAQVQVLDEAGKARATYKMPRDLGFAKIVSSDPLVVAAFSEDMKLTDYFSIDRSKGTLRSKIAVDPERTMKACTLDAQAECPGLAVGNDRLYLATAPRPEPGKAAASNEIVSYDLATGKATGQRADSGGKTPVFPLRMDGRDVLAYRQPTTSTPGQVFRLDGRTFKETVFLSVPPDGEDAQVLRHFAPGTVEFRYARGRLFTAELYIREPYSKYEPTYLAAAFGAG